MRLSFVIHRLSKATRRLWPAIGNRSLSRFLSKIDEFPSRSYSKTYYKYILLFIYKQSFAPFFSHFNILSQLLLQINRLRGIKTQNQPSLLVGFVFYERLNYFFTLSTIALKAAGLFIARSARTLRLISIPAL